MSDDPADIPPEERKLFRDSVGQVQPLRHTRTVPELPKPQARPLQTEREQQQVLQELAFTEPATMELETGDELSFRRPGIQTQLFRRLRRGYFVIEAELDLHGETSASAKTMLAEFLAGCLRTNRRCVRIIHGKGRGSRDGKPIIKNKLNHWLQLREEVLAFCSARPVDGGTGAVYVLLRKSAEC